MGALHEGHLSLMREGKKRADNLVVSVYVNPTQFGPKEDLSKYPRDKEADFEKCRSCGADTIFFPSDAMMYPEGYATYINVERLGEYLCGKSRPTHFRGVTTVCAKLFTIIAPHVAIFGEKDFQQLTIIRRMVADLNMPLEIAGMPIIRESDGLAMSSRNRYLSPAERTAALSLKRSIDRAQAMVKGGERNTETIRAEVRTIIESTKIPKVDYVSIVDPLTLEDASQFPARLCIAAFVGTTRLIDNGELI